MDSSVWLLFSVVIVGCAIYFNQFIRHIARFIYLSSKAPLGPISQYIDFYFNILFRDNVLEVVTDLVESYDYKPVAAWFRLTFGLMLSDPDTVAELFKNKYIYDKSSVLYNSYRAYFGNGLLTLNGPTYKQRRKIFSSAFRKPTMVYHLPLINAQSEALVQSLRNIADGKSVNLFSILDHHICVVALLVFSSGAFADPELISSLQANKDIMVEIQKRETNPPYYWTFYKLKKSTRIVEAKINTELANFARVMVEKRSQALRQQKEGQLPASYFNLILEDGTFTDKELVEDSRFLLNAAYDTILSVVESTILVLAARQDIQQRVYEELSSIFGKSRRPIEPADLDKMVYLEMVLKEVLRMYPVGPIVAKKVYEETVIGGILLPKGSDVSISIFNLHRNPNVFKDPLTFDPDRFLPENARNIHPYAWIPFSHGPRHCPGQVQGFFVAKSFLCDILRNFKVLPGDGFNSMSDIKPTVHMLLFVNELQLRLVCREDV